MDDVEKACTDALALHVQREKFHYFKNNCVHKSFKFRKLCRKAGISARVVIAVCIQTFPRLHIKTFIIHAHVVAEGVRYEVAHENHWRGVFGSSDFKIRPIPILSIRI